MGVDSEKLKRAIASFNNQITRITKIRDLYPVGNKIRENLEDLINKLIEDRNGLTHTTDAFLKAQGKTEKVVIKEDVIALVKKSENVEEVNLEKVVEILNKNHKEATEILNKNHEEAMNEIRNNSMSKKMSFSISLAAGVVMLIIGIVIGKVYLQ